MGDIRNAADNAFRDMESPGSSVPHEPVKSEIRQTFAIVENAVLGGAFGPRAYPDWATMDADTTQPAHTYGLVPVSDEGTHTDPVVGGTVDNSGVYAYSDESPSGWERIGNVNSESNIVPCEAANDAGTWTLTVRPGYSAPAGDNASKWFWFAAPADSGPSTYIEVEGVNIGDQRLLNSPELSQVIDGEITAGATVAVRLRGHDDDIPAPGTFEVMVGWVKAPPAQNQAFFKLAETGRVNNVISLDSAFGDDFPNNTGVSTLFAWEVETDLLAEFEVVVKLAGINPDDGFPLQDADGAPVDPLTLKQGNLVFFTRDGEVAYFTVLQPWSSTTAAAESSSLDTYYYAGAASMNLLKAQGR